MIARLFMLSCILSVANSYVIAQVHNERDIGFQLPRETASISEMDSIRLGIQVATGLMRSKNTGILSGLQLRFNPLGMRSSVDLGIAYGSWKSAYAGEDWRSSVHVNVLINLYLFSISLKKSQTRHPGGSLHFFLSPGFGLMYMGQTVQLTSQEDRAFGGELSMGFGCDVRIGNHYSIVMMPYRIHKVQDCDPAYIRNGIYRSHTIGCVWNISGTR